MVHGSYQSHWLVLMYNIQKITHRSVTKQILDCIGQPMFEWRWAFRVVTGDKEADDRIIASTDPEKTFQGAEWGVGIP